MKIRISGICLAATLLILSEPDIAAQRILAPQASEQRGGSQDFGIWAPRVAIFKDYFNRLLPKASGKGFVDGIHLSTYDYRRWTEEDLKNLATSSNGIDLFSGLMYMKNSAGIKDAGGNYTAKAVQAQNALTELKPDDCKTWKSFFNWIVRVEEANKRTIISLMKQKHLDIPPGYGLLTGGFPSRKTC